MPYARKRFRKRTKRRYSRRFRSRRKSLYKSKRYRPTYRRKQPASKRRKYGAFDSFGNSLIPNKVLKTLYWNEPAVSNIIFAQGGGTQKVFPGESYDVTVPYFVKSEGEVKTKGPSARLNMMNWDVYSSKYQRAYTKEFRISTTFAFENEREVGNSDFILCGFFITRNDLRNNLTNIGDWELLKRSKNVVYKKFNKNVSAQCTVTATVNVGKCLAAATMIDRYAIVYPIELIWQQANRNRLAESYPNDSRLFIVQFVVPMTRSVDTDSPINCQTRTVIKKVVCFDRPLGDPTETALSNNYPATGTTLPNTYEPQYIRPSGLLDDTKDNEQDDRLEDLENGQNIQDDQAQFFFNTNADSIAEVADDLAAHEALEGKQAH